MKAPAKLRLVWAVAALGMVANVSCSSSGTKERGNNGGDDGDSGGSGGSAGRAGGSGGSAGGSAGSGGSSSGSGGSSAGSGGSSAGAGGSSAGSGGSSAGSGGSSAGAGGSAAAGAGGSGTTLVCNGGSGGTVDPAARKPGTRGKPECVGEAVKHCMATDSICVEMLKIDAPEENYCGSPAECGPCPDYSKVAGECDLVDESAANNCYRSLHYEPSYDSTTIVCANGYVGWSAM